MAEQSPTLLGKKINIIPDIDRPMSVAVDKDGFIYVAESKTSLQQTVNIYDKDGAKIRSFGVAEVDGFTVCYFSSIAGVAIANDGQVLITDEHRVHKVLSDGSNRTKLIGTCDEGGSGQLEFRTPMGMAVHPSTGQIYVADQYNHRIQVLNSDFTYSYSIGEKGVQPGQLYNPQDVALDSKGNVYVVNSTINCIDVFTPEGKHIRRFGKEGSGKGELYFPTSIAIDANDNFVYVSELDNNRISIFDTKGNFIKHYGCYGRKEGEFDGPRSITIDHSGRLFVCDYGNKRIVIVSN